MPDQDSLTSSPVPGVQPLSEQLHLDVHSTAPLELKELFKHHAASHSDRSVENPEDVIDLQNVPLPGLESISPARRAKAFGALRGPLVEAFCITRFYESQLNDDRKRGKVDFEPKHFPLSTREHDKRDIPHSHGSAFTFKQIPGLIFLPNLLPPDIQIELLGRLLHRDLFNPAHQTNVHAFHEMQYPTGLSSLFSSSPILTLHPKDPSIHKPWTMKQVLEQKLRWMTLGGQYDWTEKAYPTEQPPEFPNDIASLIHHLFPDMEPQAAIVNLYSPGDKLSMHRDLSEEIDEGLVSISLGCSCLFMIGLEDEATHEIRKLTLRLRSGDVLYMTGESRLAWHGVPRIEKGTCPNYLEEWPGDYYPAYKRWMNGKRINLNVRQMRPTTLQEEDYTATPPPSVRIHRFMDPYFPPDRRRTPGLGISGPNADSDVNHVD